jgi:hypothetical protein
MPRPERFARAEEDVAPALPKSAIRKFPHRRLALRTDDSHNSLTAQDAVRKNPPTFSPCRTSIARDLQPSASDTQETAVRFPPHHDAARLKLAKNKVCAARYGEPCPANSRPASFRELLANITAGASPVRRCFPRSQFRTDFTIICPFRRETARQ